MWRVWQASQAWEARMPSERSLVRAVYELLVTGSWLQANTRYDDYPDDREDDVDEFVSVQTNVGLLAALMLTIMGDMLFNYAETDHLLQAVLTVLIWTSTLLYFVSCTWSVFNIMVLSQSDTREEAVIVLFSMRWRAAMPVRLWVYASLNLGVTFFVWFINLVVSKEDGKIAARFGMNTTETGDLIAEWVTVSICCSEVIFTALYLIYCVALNVQLV